MKVTDASQIRALDLNRQSDANRAQKPEAPDTEDRVSTEESARVAAAVAAAARRGGGSRAQMLHAIETAVRQGTYRPDPGRIAQQILDEAELAARLQILLGR
ncbi:MAG TPA: flagellar biosynthesis anti-sigma factor FlgM [Anaeromyxobacteraceae bacterium]|jgi:negative regulator of flagellin synthesis FlgM